jgi:Uma2 family endonuclease
MLDVVEPQPLVVQNEMDDEQFFRFCQLNRELQIERNAQGELIIMPPVGGSSSHGNIEVASKLHEWAKRDRTGRAFDSSAGFNLPNGATRSPDASWVLKERLQKLSKGQRDKFLPLCPDFVLELRSPSDSVRMLKEKMDEYVENGAQLGWLLDPVARQVHVYRPDAPPQTLNNPSVLAGDPILPGFKLNVVDLWREMENTLS